MELLEGRTLKEMISGKPQPHSDRDSRCWQFRLPGRSKPPTPKGIVHRDIKPANIFVIQQRRIKVLDFGIAKLVKRRWGRIRTRTTASVEAHRTEPGMVMGIVWLYVSRAGTRSGDDGRTDIFAFGAILYEMLTGQRAFEKPTSAEPMAAILNQDPPAISEFAPNTPPALVRIVTRCLEKDPEQRFQSASDLAFALEALLESSGAMTSAGVTQLFSSPDSTPAI